MALGMNCPKCGDPHVNAIEVDERQLFRCGDCRHQWYSERKMTNGSFVFLDEIVDDVLAKGRHEMHIAILLNCVWPSERFSERIEKWTAAHGFGYEIFYRKEGRKEKEQWVRFSRLRT